MKYSILAIFKTSAPLIFAMLGALLTEDTGSLAIFMEGAITLSGFFSVIFVIYTGSKVIGFFVSTILIVLITTSMSIFINRCKANPFLVGLAINMFAEGISNFYTTNFSKTHTIAFSSFPATSHITSSTSIFPSVIAILCTVLLFLFLKYTSYGVRLKYIGQHEETLYLHGVSCNKYKIASWSMAGFFASCAGSALVFRLGAYTPSMSLGKGWIGILAVFLGLKKPLLCLLAVFIFATAEYGTNILQVKSELSPTLMLSFPYILSLLLYIAYKITDKHKG
ncbi:MAG: ABC transporter permease subunit [Treponema sp.]